MMLDPMYSLREPMDEDKVQEALVAAYEDTLALRYAFSDAKGEPIKGKARIWKHLDEANSHIRLAAEQLGILLP